ncbi:MAG: RNA-binding transcriptional accessory protein, partial [Anaerolineae bacterium]
MNHIIAQTLNLPVEKINAAVTLLDDGNTIPFIARYRKEATGNLDEEQLRAISAELARLRTLEMRRETVLKTIREQGKLTPELEAKIQGAASLTELEDLYQPYKPKRRTRASIARERGLQPLAELILKQERPAEDLETLAQSFLGEEVPDAESAWAGARDIVAETISETAEVRQRARQKALQWATLYAEKAPDADDPKGVYADYYEFSQRIDRLQPHQVLALNRGEREGILRLHVDIPERDWRAAVQLTFRPDPRSPLRTHLLEAVEDAAKRLLLPAIERDVRRILTEKADSHAIR